LAPRLDTLGGVSSPHLSWVLLAVAPLLGLGCSVDAPQGAPLQRSASAAPSPARADGLVVHFEPEPGLRFPVPAANASIRVWHYDTTLPARKFRHAIHVVTPRGVALLIHVWDNPKHLGVGAWFDETLSGFVDEDTVRSERTMSSAHLAGILLEQPASPQAVSQAVAVLVTAEHAFTVTCMNPVDDPEARALFERVVEELEPEVAQ
jgi:hypothetical protein